MPWILDIHIIDVGQGESSFIVARDPQAGLTRSMLIDGGLVGAAEAVDAYVAATTVPVDHIVTTHYDVDHSGGIKALLIADNLFAICEAVGATAALGDLGAPREKQIAGVAAAACSAMFGAYGAMAQLALPAVTLARLTVAAGASDAEAAKAGCEQAWEYQDTLKSLGALPPMAYKAVTLNEVATLVAIAAANAGGVNVADAGRDAAFTKLARGTPAGSRFKTFGRYAHTHIIDIGQAPIDGYPGAIIGKYLHGNDTTIQAPNRNRARTIPALGNEVLFNSGMNAGPPPANAPAAVVTAINATTWPTGQPIPPSGQSDNDVSIGLAVQFNNFLYWTAGDLPSQGEDLVAAAVMAGPLPAPGGGNYPQATRIACFKCGHHGSNSATSQAFLNAATPVGALLSCGDRYEHPNQLVINRLHAQASVQFFYLTNCIVVTAHVPGAANQLTAAGNKSRVAGDNTLPNNMPGRRRGDIHLTIGQAAASLAAGNAGRQYTVTYWEEDTAPPGPRAELSTF